MMTRTAAMWTAAMIQIDRLTKSSPAAMPRQSHTQNIAINIVPSVINAVSLVANSIAAAADARSRYIGRPLSHDSSIRITKKTRTDSTIKNAARNAHNAALFSPPSADARLSADGMNATSRMITIQMLAKIPDRRWSIKKSTATTIAKLQKTKNISCIKYLEM